MEAHPGPKQGLSAPKSEKMLPKKAVLPRERWLREKKRKKTRRVVFQALLLLLFVLALLRYQVFPQRYRPASVPAAAPVSQSGLAADTVSSVDAAESSRFIAIAYSGLSPTESLNSKIVSQRAFEEQLSALHASGYVTITQQDILDYYANHTPLPKKALFLIFEDGIFNTATLAQSALKRHNYIATMCTYAANLTDENSKFATAQDLKLLLNNSFWELGTNGYRLSYINTYDRYGNYFGGLNTNEFVQVSGYLKRDYNHYLMDFLRDEDRLRTESVEQMRLRLQNDYSSMRQIYEAELGSVPGLYILMHSNTGAFGNDPLVSEENRDLLTALFSMNFNRQGSCLNDLHSSVFDLARLQSQAYFSTNHLLMRIADDTGDEVAFVTGDEEQAALWYIDQGAAEFRKNKIILTSEPYGEGLTVLNTGLFSDLDLSVQLEGNKVGVQSVYLRTDRSLSEGVQVALANNQLVIRQLGTAGREIFRLDLFEFDGGPSLSTAEDENNSLMALCEAVIRYDEDPLRVARAQMQLDKLKNSWPINLAEGGAPYLPELDIAQRDSRSLRITLKDDRLSVWLDGRRAAEELPVSVISRGCVALGAEVWKNDDDKYSQANLYDDVYDAVFTDPVICSAEDPNTVYYSYRLNDLQKVEAAIGDALNSVIAFFLQRF